MSKMNQLSVLGWVSIVLMCGQGIANENSATRSPPPMFASPPPPPKLSPLDVQLTEVIRQFGLTGEVSEARAQPDIHDPLAQLGMKLFFSKGLGGEKSVACASCHHPSLGGADGLSLAVGVNAERENVIGPGRTPSNDFINIPRNSPTIFNVGLANQALFWDGRVERVSLTTPDGTKVEGVSTPDSGFQVIDDSVPNNLVNALARFPVTSTEEMRGEGFANAISNSQIREHIAERIGDYGQQTGDLATNDWLAEFREAFNSTEEATSLITFDSIALALGIYQQSMTLVDTQWHRYVRGDKRSLSEAQKRGALLFFTPQESGGAGCVACHSGERFTNEGFFNLAFPQFGPGTQGDHSDRGRAQVTGAALEQFAFRVPSLINVSLSAPYGHAGAYQSLAEVVRHYVNPRASVEGFFARGGACHLRQFNRFSECERLNEGGEQNSEHALQLLAQSPFQPARLNVVQQQDLVAFLESLTDQCAKDIQCVSKFTPSHQHTNPDNLRLIATDRRGKPL